MEAPTGHKWRLIIEMQLKKVSLSATASQVLREGKPGRGRAEVGLRRASTCGADGVQCPYYLVPCRRGREGAKREDAAKR